MAVQSFRTWMKQANEACFEHSGVSIHDLPDFNYRDAFDDGETPQEVALAVLGENGMDF